MTAKITTIDEVILHSFSEFVRAKAEEIIQRHTKQASDELDKAVRTELSNIVLSLGTYMSIDRVGTDLRILIHDKRKE